MSRSSILMVVGVLTLLAPFLGLPYSLRVPLIVVLGIVVFLTGLIERTRRERAIVNEPNAPQPIVAADRAPASAVPAVLSES